MRQYHLRDFPQQNYLPDHQRFRQLVGVGHPSRHQTDLLLLLELKQYLVGYRLLAQQHLPLLLSPLLMLQPLRQEDLQLELHLFHRVAPHLPVAHPLWALVRLHPVAHHQVALLHQVAPLHRGGNHLLFPEEQVHQIGQMPRFGFVNFVKHG